MTGPWPRLVRMLAAAAAILLGAYVIRASLPALSLVLTAVGGTAFVLVVGLMVVVVLRARRRG